MRGRRAFLFTLVASTVAAGACADLSGLTGSGPDGGPSDGGPLDVGAPENATPLDAAPDVASPPDGSLLDGASPDAAAEASSGPLACTPAVLGVRCAGVDAAVSCDDFDESLTIPGTWQISGDDGGTFLIDPDASTSSPNSLLVFQQPDPIVETGLELHRDLPLGGAQPNRASVSADIRLDESGTATFYALDLTFQPVSTSGGAYVVDILFAGGEVYYAENANPSGDYNNESCFNMADANWHHYSLTVDLAAQTAWVTLDSYPPCVLPLKYATEAPHPWLLGVDIGGPYLDAADGGPWLVHQDSVVVCAE